ncbi:hypothetical protein D3C76_950210 [compost metagenome]
MLVGDSARWRAVLRRLVAAERVEPDLDTQFRAVEAGHQHFAKRVVASLLGVLIGVDDACGQERSVVDIENPCHAAIRQGDGGAQAPVLVIGDRGDAMALGLLELLDVIKTVQAMVRGEAFAHGPQVALGVGRVFGFTCRSVWQEPIHDVVADFRRFEFLLEVERHVAVRVLELVVGAQGRGIQFGGFGVVGQGAEDQFIRLQ